MSLSIGFAAIDLTSAVQALPTPPDLSGFVARLGPSTGIHDPIFARAVVLRDDAATLALATIDVLGIDREMLAAVRHGVHVRTGIAPDGVCVAASHSHSAPATMRLHNCGRPLTEWRQALVRGIIDAVAAAASRLIPGRLGFASAEGPGLARNRRAGNGPVDPRLHLVRFDDATGRPLGLLAHFACHPVVLGPDNRLISADYPGALIRRLEAEGLFALYANGACGDINPAERGSPAAMEAMGDSLAETALALWPAITTSDRVPLAARTATAELRYRAPLPDRAALAETGEAHRTRLRELAAVPPNADATGQAAARRVEEAMALWAEAMLERIERSPDRSLPRAAPVDLQILQIGGWSLVPLPGEIFCATGLAVRSRLAGRGLVLGYANGNVGYIPVQAAYPLGGYEVDQAYKYYDQPAVFASDEAERLVDLVTELAGMEPPAARINEGKDLR